MEEELKGRSNNLEELTEKYTAGLKAINELLQQETGKLRYYGTQMEALDRAHDEL